MVGQQGGGEGLTFLPSLVLTSPLTTKTISVRDLAFIQDAPKIPDAF
jgi:hypothetical protein